MANEPFTHRTGHLPIGQHVFEHVFTEATRGKHTHLPLNRVTHVTRMLEGLPRALEEEPVLGVEHGRITRAETKKCRIELIHIG